MSKETPSKDESTQKTNPTPKPKGSKPSAKATIKPALSVFEERDELADEKPSDTVDKGGSAKPAKPKKKAITKKTKE